MCYRRAAPSHCLQVQGAEPEAGNVAESSAKSSADDIDDIFGDFSGKKKLKVEKVSASSHQAPEFTHTSVSGGRAGTAGGPRR